MLILSRWIALLCLLSSCAHEPAVASTTLAGTRWTFPPESPARVGGPIEVTFLADGTARFSGLPAGSQPGGHWKQDGNELVFDCNDFTEYRVAIDGPRMTGQWKRLKGPEEGQPHPSSLERLEAPAP